MYCSCTRWSQPLSSRVGVRHLVWLGGGTRGKGRQWQGGFDLGADSARRGREQRVPFGRRRAARPRGGYPGDPVCIGGRVARPGRRVAAGRGTRGRRSSLQRRDRGDREGQASGAGRPRPWRSPTAPDRELVLAAVRAGARGIIERTVHSASLARIVRRAAAGEVTLPRHLLGYVLDELARVERRVDANVALTPLSTREREVLSLIGQGSTQSRDCRDPLDLRVDGQAPRAQHAREAPSSHPGGCSQPRRRRGAAAPQRGRCLGRSALVRQPDEKAHARVAPLPGRTVREGQQNTVGAATAPRSRTRRRRRGRRS